MNPREAELAILRGVLTPLMPLLEEALVELEEKRLKAALTLLRDGGLTAEEALEALVEIKVLRDLWSKMRHKVAAEVEEHHG